MAIQAKEDSKTKNMGRKKNHNYANEMHLIDISEVTFLSCGSYPYVDKLHSKGEIIT